MATNDNSQVRYESAQSVQAWEAMTNTGDNITFAASFSPFSQASGFQVVIRPYGLATGGVITPAAGGGNNNIDIAAMTLYMPGAASSDSNGLISVSATTDETVLRPTVSNFLITSITVNDSGAIAQVQGTEGSAFSTTRAAAGGPPLIPADSVEVGQIHYNSQTAAVVLTSEIFQVPGDSCERTDFPVISTTDYARGRVTFSDALPLIHTGSIPKEIWVTGYTPIFAVLPRASNFVPAETAHTTDTVETYDGAIGSVSSTLNACTFEAVLNDGHTDPILNQKDDTVWIEFKQDRNRAPKSLTLGKLGVARTHNVGEQVIGTFTLAADAATRDFES